MTNKEIAEKTKELGRYFDGMPTYEIIKVVSAFVAGLIAYSVNDKENYDKAVDEFANCVRGILVYMDKKGDDE